MSKVDEKPKCVPLCYPDNYYWDQKKAKLVEKKKARGRLVVCEDALDILRKIDGPICPVAVTGPARCGKSYIASQLIEPRPDYCVFQTSAKMKPQTMGIWMSTDVFQKTLSNGTEVTVIIMDTEGLDAYNAHKHDDMLMFALIALMSSVLVYNNKGSVSAEDINKLSWLNKLNDVFCWTEDYQKTSTPIENNFIRFFPNFIWLLRDATMSFVLTRHDDDEEVDFKQYLLEEAKTAKYSEDGSTCVGGHLHKILKQNETESAKFCTDLAKTLATELDDPQPGLSRTRHYSTGSKKNYINEQYMERARGPQKLHVYKTVLAKEIDQIAKYRNPSSDSDKVEKETEETKDAQEEGEHLPEDIAAKEDIEKEESEKQIRSMKTLEEEEMRKIRNEDFANQQDQLQADFLETIATLKTQITTIGSTHGDLVRDLQLLFAQLEEENKEKKEVLNRKREEMVR
ncbi:guanylate-binding protein 5-like [Ptychodera flava]|uniref:guanylate-binding protein 5-like n=1 Tax=Ptychodera flava TaxID=63121 RepID=UPI00396A4B96